MNYWMGYNEPLTSKGSRICPNIALTLYSGKTAHQEDDLHNMAKLWIAVFHGAT